MRSSFCCWHVFEFNAHGLPSCLYKAVPEVLPSALDISDSLSLHSPSSTTFPVPAACYSLQQTFTSLLCWTVNWNPELDSTGGREQKLLCFGLGPQQPVWDHANIYETLEALWRHRDIMRKWLESEKQSCRTSSLRCSALASVQEIDQTMRGLRM